MKLILTQEVTGLGAPGDIVEVKDGYGRNYLVPRGFAIRWTKGGEKQIESIKAARNARAVRDLDKAQEIKGQLEGSPSTCRSAPVRAVACSAPSPSPTSPRRSTSGRRPSDGSTSVRIVVGNPIKSLGAHTVTVKVHDELEAKVLLQRRPRLIRPRVIPTGVRAGCPGLPGHPARPRTRAQGSEDRPIPSIDDGLVLAEHGHGEGTALSLAQDPTGKSRRILVVAASRFTFSSVVPVADRDLPAPRTPRRDEDRRAERRAGPRGSRALPGSGGVDVLEVAAPLLRPPAGGEPHLVDVPWQRPGGRGRRRVDIALAVDPGDRERVVALRPSR